MVLRSVLAALAAAFLCAPLAAQQRVDPRNMYERALCVVPMVGTGTPDNPRRPQYAPLPPAPGTPPSRDGIIAFSYQVSDDGKFALVEFVAVDRKAFKEVLADANPSIKAFIKGQHQRADIESEFKKHKKDFSLDQFQGAIVP
jgi:hypothetical protein